MNQEEEEEEEITTETLPASGSDIEVSSTTYSQAASNDPEGSEEDDRVSPLRTDNFSRLVPLGDTPRTPEVQRRSQRTRYPPAIYTPSTNRSREITQGNNSPDIENTLGEGITVDINTPADEDDSNNSASSGSRPVGPFDPATLFGDNNISEIYNTSSLSTSASSVPDQSTKPSEKEFWTVSEEFIDNDTDIVSTATRRKPSKNLLNEISNFKFTYKEDEFPTVFAGHIPNIIKRIKRVKMSASTKTPVSTVKSTPPTFDKNLESILKNMLKTTLSGVIARTLVESHVGTFDQFRSIELDDLHDFQDVNGNKLHKTLIR